MNYYSPGGQMDLSDRIAIETGICNKDSFKKIAKLFIGEENFRRLQIHRLNRNDNSKNDKK